MAAPTASKQLACRHQGQTHPKLIRKPKHIIHRLLRLRGRAEIGNYGTQETSGHATGDRAMIEGQ